MKTTLIIALFFSVCFSTPALCAAAEVQPVQVEVLYMNHGPMRPTIRGIQDVLARQGANVTQGWYDFESAEGAEFKEEKGVTQHVPCMIWINGMYSFDVDGKEVQFVGFPTGSGPAFFQGNWTMEELEKAITAALTMRNPETN
jgi:hypothetical protein